MYVEIAGGREAGKEIRRDQFPRRERFSARRDLLMRDAWGHAFLKGWEKRGFIRRVASQDAVIGNAGRWQLNLALPRLRRLFRGKRLFLGKSFSVFAELFLVMLLERLRSDIPGTSDETRIQFSGAAKLPDIVRIVIKFESGSSSRDEPFTVKSKIDHEPN